MTQKDQWIADALTSIDGLQRAQAPAGLHHATVQKLTAGTVRTIRLSPKTIWLMAAGLLLLIGVNAYTLFSHSSEAGRIGNFAAQKSPVITEYFTPPPSI